MAYTTIKKPSDYFNTKLYTGNGSTQSITGVGFQPDFTWLKHRNNGVAYSHQLFDSVRTATKYLVSNDSAYEVTDATTLTSFDSDGFSLGTNVGINQNTINHVGWNWKANGAGVANTDGSISSTVSANTTSGFSIVSYTGNGTDGATVGTGLTGLSLVIVKSRGDGTFHWVVKHKSLSGDNNVYLNLTNASGSASSSGSGGIGALNSSTFPLEIGTGGASVFQTNKSSDTYIAYCFSEVQGFSKFGSYVGNGSTDGTFVYTGFKPAFVMVKRTDSTSSWAITDGTRDTFNVVDNYLSANNTNAESDFDHADFLSNGIKFRTTNDGWNVSGGTYIYMAFAEEPLVGDNPATAR